MATNGYFANVLGQIKSLEAQLANLNASALKASDEQKVAQDEEKSEILRSVNRSAMSRRKKMKRTMEYQLHLDLTKLKQQMSKTSANIHLLTHQILTLQKLLLK